MKFDTLIAHAGLDRNDPTGSLATPIYQTATFRHPEFGKSTGYDYTRTKNPTRETLEKAAALLEEGHAGFAFSSGMAAITAISFLFNQGDHLIISEDLYGGTYRLFEKIFRQFGLEVTYTDSTQSRQIENSIQKNTKALIIETPSNPMMLRSAEITHCS
jgi:cystathionine beta-lyase/cystathionine gamma-synthase